MTNGEKIKQLRTDYGITQEALATKLNTSQMVVHAWEVNKLAMEDFLYNRAKDVMAELAEEKVLSGAQIEPKKRKPVPQQKVDTKHCVGCAYWRTVAPTVEGIKCCHYILDNERKRPCPPGKDCTEYTKKKRARRRWDGFIAYEVKESGK